MKHTLIFKNDTITLSQGNDGYWLYDATRGQNIAMRAKTEQEAFIQALTYYQKRLTTIENNFKVLNDKVAFFVSTVVDEEDSL